jgi:predicted ATPase
MNVKRVSIERFKGLQPAAIALSRISVLTGPNNSGKSSVLQAIQFATSIAQTAKAYTSRLDAGTLASEQLIYSPLRDVEALAPSGRFTQSRDNAIRIALEGDLGGSTIECAVTVRRGKNRNLSFTITDNELGQKLAAIELPFSVYVTGLAGIPRQEEFKSEGLVRKAASRGDANSVLRNVLLLLSNDANSWEQFLADLRQVFPGIALDVHFDPTSNDFIEVRLVQAGGVALPIDAAGTGVLQTIQILSYVNVYKPSLLLVDEPDSHLHPNNQRSLARVLSEIAERRDLQVLVTTHSRHLLDELRSTSTTFWFDKGKPVSQQFDFVQALIDLGALDEIDSLSQLDAIILTEDSDTSLIAEIARGAIGEFKYEIRSYSGSSNLENTLLLADFIREKAPRCRIVVHRDRDYETDATTSRISARLSGGGITPLITEGVDLEGAILSPEHISSVYPEISPERASELLNIATESAKHTSVERLTNARVKQDAERVGGLGSVNHGEVARLAEAEYEANSARFRHGKTVLGHLSSLVQRELQRNPVLKTSSATLNGSHEARVLVDALHSSATANAQASRPRQARRARGTSPTART